jgi:hypothetical protein
MKKGGTRDAVGSFCQLLPCFISEIRATNVLVLFLARRFLMFEEGELNHRFHSAA